MILPPATIRLIQAFLILPWLLLGPEVFGFPANTPVTPGASPEAQSVLTFFADIYGKKVVAGQHDGWRLTNGLSAELNYITNTTGKLPALLEMDLGGLTPDREDPRHRLAQHAIEWFNDRHGLVAFCCHWRAPMDKPAFYVKETSFDITRAVTPGTPEYAATERSLDHLAEELEVLRDAHVPVLWRPLHEANGRWFWWGAGGPEPFKKLWHMMFENFTVKHHLNNLIWVFSPGAETDLAQWYPGDAYVDIIGQDHYPMDGNHRPATDVFNELTRMTRGQKLIALGENGPIPDPALMKQEQAGWLFFSTWSGSILYEKTTPEQLRAYYNNLYVLTLADMPDLKKYAGSPVGKPVKLAFPRKLGAMAVGGTRRMPLTVAVEDQHGETVREGTYTVTLALKKPRSGTLSGTLTATTVNGIATFPDVTVDSALAGCKFTAAAAGLKSATSPAFAVGPGTGLWHEWWLNQTNVFNFSTVPVGHEIWRTALESPVETATNFYALTAGELIAPQSGQYQFWLAGGGQSELWLSTDASPTNRVKIAAVTAATTYRKWPHTSEADARPVTLAAGHHYYFEIRQWQKNGSTQLHVGWQLPDGTEQRPVPAYYFVPAVETPIIPPTASILTQANDQN